MILEEDASEKESSSKSKLKNNEKVRMLDLHLFRVAKSPKETMKKVSQIRRQTAKLQITLIVRTVIVNV